MFARRNRFHGRGGLNAVYSRGQTVRGQLLNLKFLTRNSDKPYRLAVVVSRKVSKSAVVRNRIRRRVYAVVREHAEGLKPGTDLVFTAYSDKLAEIQPDKLKKQIDELLQKAK